MIDVHAARRVWIYPQPTDLRKGFCGLYALVQHHLHLDPLDGDLFLFLNARRTTLKALQWDGTGLCLFAKRIPQKRFDHLWRQTHTGAIELSRSQLFDLIHGKTGVINKLKA